MRPVIHPGPWLLQPGTRTLDGHRALHGRLPILRTADLVSVAEHAALLGRGGAGFPFATKLRACAGRRSFRRHVVVNVAEGEPASAKDAGLVATAPHLVLDGAALTARALGCPEVDLVVPHERPWVAEALRTAIGEREDVRADGRLRWRFHAAAARFVSGASSAVAELVSGRENLPVTTWRPAAEKGAHGRPTLLSNAETFAQLAALALSGTRPPGPPDEPGSRLLSITRTDGIHVVETAHGAAWSDVLTAAEIDGPVLLGGYHGVWVPPGALRRHTVSAAMRDHEAPLGAGVVVPAGGSCPLHRTAEILSYLAAQSAGRCGPCFHGLPALSDAFGTAVRGGGVEQVDRLAGLVAGRGACSHPDGTVRLARSALALFEEEWASHAAGGCTWSRPAPTASVEVAG